MTWLRLDCDSPDHPIIGLLADEVGSDTDRAYACYVRTLLGFGDHRLDGQPAFVADVTLEAWARWKGKAGRWSAAFRKLCIESRDDQKDAPGVIKGWWRQAALLREQERSRLRPGQGTRKATDDPDKGTGKAPEKPPDTSPVPFRGNVDVDGNDTRTTTTAGQRTREGEPPVDLNSPEARLIAKMGRDPDRWAIWDFLERIPDPQQLPWVHRLAGYLEGLDFPAGVCPTPEQLATACRDYAGDFSPAHFRGFVLRAIRGPRVVDGSSGPRRGTPAEQRAGSGQLEAAARWASQGGDHAGS